MPYFYKIFMENLGFLVGEVIAHRIQFWIAKNNASKTELGKALTGNAGISKRAYRKRYERFLKKLKTGQILRELNITADFLDLPIEYVLFGIIGEDPALS